MSSRMLKRENEFKNAQVHVCPHCARFFLKHHAFTSHALDCKQNLERQRDQTATDTVRPATEMAQDPVHSAASLGIEP
jgi:hypothetical protein